MKDLAYTVNYFLFRFFYAFKHFPVSAHVSLLLSNIYIFFFFFFRKPNQLTHTMGQRVPVKSVWRKSL